MPKKNVLVTGLFGFTGQHLARELIQSGYSILGLVRPESDNFTLEGLNSSDIEVVKCDLVDYRSVVSVLENKKIDFVIHLAAQPFVAHDDVTSVYLDNIVATRNLLSALAQMTSKPERVILASSANVYGNVENSGITEHQTYSPLNDYAISKVAVEYVASLFQEALSICTVRPFNYTGKGQNPKFLVPKIVEHFRQRSPIIELGNIDVMRDFSDVRQVVQIYRKLLALPNTPRTLNICSGRSISLRDIIQMCSELTQHTIEIKVNPDFVRANEVKTLAGDPTLLYKTLPDISAIEFSDTLKWMLGQP